MDLHTLEIQNFLSFGPKQTLDLQAKGLVFIEGENRDDSLGQSNGAGKSALIEAIFWGVFGRTLRGLKGDAVINRQLKKDCQVLVAGQHQGQAFQVVRSRRVGGTVTGGLTFHIAGRDRTAANDTVETQRRVENFLGYTPEVFAHTVVFGQGDQWRFTDLSDADRKNLLDRLLGFERISRAHAWARNKLSEAQGLKTHAAHAIQLAEQRREAAKALWQQLKAERKRYVAEQKADLKNRIQELKQELVEVPELDAADYTDKLRALEEKLTELRDKVDAAGRAVAVAKAEVERLRQVASDESQRLKAYRKPVPGALCGACGQVLEESHLRRRIQTQQAVLEKANEAVDNSRKRVSEARARCDTLTERYEALTAKVMRVRVKQTVQSTQAQRRQQAEATNARIGKHVAQAREKLRSLAKPEPSQREQDAKESWGKAEADLESLGAAKEAADALVGHLDFWVGGFGPGGIKSHLLDHVVPVLNQHAQGFAQQIASDLRVEFASQSTLKSGAVRDKLALNVEYAHGSDTYQGASQGERRKADIVVALALNAIVQGDRRCNLGVWDEVFESLDETSAEAVMGLLRKEMEQKGTLLVISHQEWLKAHFPHSLTVCKEGGFSRIAPQ